MSAFVVADTTINRILEWLRRTDDYPRYRNPWYKEEIAKAAEIGRSDEEFYVKLGQAMHNLNLDAVNDRYQENTTASEFRYARMPHATDIQALKSLQCWLYQCSEGNVPERPLYQAFELASGRLALDIVGRLKEYETAAWS